MVSVSKRTVLFLIAYFESLRMVLRNALQERTGLLE